MGNGLHIARVFIFKRSTGPLRTREQPSRASHRDSLAKRHNPDTEECSRRPNSSSGGTRDGDTLKRRSAMLMSFGGGTNSALKRSKSTEDVAASSGDACARKNYTRIEAGANTGTYSWMLGVDPNTVERIPEKHGSCRAMSNLEPCAKGLLYPIKAPFVCSGSCRNLK